MRVTHEPRATIPVHLQKALAGRGQLTTPATTLGHLRHRIPRTLRGHPATNHLVDGIPGSGPASDSEVQPLTWPIQRSRIGTASLSQEHNTIGSAVRLQEEESRAQTTITREIVQWAWERAQVVAVVDVPLVAVQASNLRRSNRTPQNQVFSRPLSVVPEAPEVVAANLEPRRRLVVESTSTIS